MTKVRTKHLQRWLIAAPVTGPRAALCALLAVAVPTLISLSIKHVAVDPFLMLYMPFILLAAVLLSWRYAAFTAIASAIVSGLWLIGAPDNILESPAEIFALASFVVVAAMLITFASAARRLAGFNISPAGAPRAPAGNIIFSLEGGVALASWYGTKEPICLGEEDEVAAMMEDFLAQRELGRRLVASLR